MTFDKELSLPYQAPSINVFFSLFAFEVVPLFRSKTGEESTYSFQGGFKFAVTTVIRCRHL